LFIVAERLIIRWSLIWIVQYGEACLCNIVCWIIGVRAMIDAFFHFGLDSVGVPSYDTDYKEYDQD
jgi:hypothetical protein